MEYIASGSRRRRPLVRCSLCRTRRLRAETRRFRALEAPRQSMEVLGSGSTAAPTRTRHNLNQGSKLLRLLTLVCRLRRIQLCPRGTSMLTSPRPMHPKKSMSSNYVLRCNNLGKVIATYVGNEPNIYVKRSLWVPKILVANTQGPNAN